MSTRGSRGVASFFEPKSIAVAGVSSDPDKLGSIIFANLVENSDKGLLKAAAYALNPAHDRIGNRPCYPAIRALPEIPELLIVAVPEPQTIGLIRTAARLGVRAAVVITGGYAEVGNVAVEKEIGGMAARHGMRILGPNTIGLVDTWSGVDSLFLRPTKPIPGGEIISMLKPLRGEIAIITQSGHLGEVITEELAANGVGIRALVGTGNQLDVSVEDMIQYFSEDERTKVIAIYLEGLHDGRRFIETATRAARRKPLIVFKVGKTAAGARAALTHTASMVGDYEVYQAAFRRAGVVEAETLQELVDYSVSLLMLPMASGRRLAIVTNAGGVGAIAADEAMKAELTVEPPEPSSKRGLIREFEGAGFASNATFGNPVDLTASVNTDQFVRAVAKVMAFPEFDLGLVLPTHQAPGMDYDVAERLGDAISRSGKPVVSCVIGNSDLAGRIHMEFMKKGVPSFPTPERAVRALAAIPRYAEAKRTAPPSGNSPRPRHRRFSAGSGPLPLREVGSLLLSYGIEEPESVTVASGKNVAKLDRSIFPAACKLLSKEMPHKSDRGGVALNVRDTAEAATVFERLRKTAARERIRFDGMLVQKMVPNGVEIILGGIRDPTFGPVVLLGLGGTRAELAREFELAIAPVSIHEARRMIEGGRLGRILGGYRGGPKVGVGRLAKIVGDFSRILIENPRIEQIEVNPLMAAGNNALSVDARAVLGPRRK